MKPEETAIHLFNKALKKLAFFNVEQSKQNAKEIVLMELLNIKEALYNVQVLDDLNIREIEKTVNHYQKVKTIIENL